MSFSLDLEKFAKKAGNNAAAVVKATALDMFAQITYRTPVDTGRARANWQVSFGTPNSSVTQSVDDSRISTNASQSVKTKAFQARQGDKIITWKQGDIWLSNNLPYISRLEYGTYGKGAGATAKTGGTGFSIQAPAGMLRITVREFQSYVDKAVREIKK